MTTPHRGLPPPSAMTLPDPGRPPPPFRQDLGPLPAPPQQWQDQEESMRMWLAARTEEDRRKQEEEKTKQESYRVEQRRIEQSMLREALQGGVPPTMIPMIYAGVGGSNLASVSLEWLQQYASQLQAAQQQFQQQSPVDSRRGDLRLMPSSQYGAPQPPQHQVVPSQPADQSQQPGAVHSAFSAYHPAPSRPPPTSAPRSATHTQLPRLTTNEIYTHPQPQQGPGSAHPLQQSQSVQDAQANSSPSIYFHHWVPPNETKSNQPQTPASKGEPHSAHPGSHLSESDYKESPRKRKAQGPHQPAPAPSSGSQFTSPPFSIASSGSGRKVSHARSRSGTDSRPQSRREPEPPRPMPTESAVEGAADSGRVRGSSPLSLPREERTVEPAAESREQREERFESRDS